MTSFTITVKDEGVQSALKALSARVNNLNPVLYDIGEKIIERTKRRFGTGTGPDGVKWEKNRQVTLAMLAARIGGKKSKVKKNGSLNAAGQRELANKQPLVGESKRLKEDFHHQVVGNSLTVNTTSVTKAYAAIHQFGGKAGRGKKVSIPARPFLPVRGDGSLYPQEQSKILDAINAYLMDGL